MSYNEERDEIAELFGIIDPKRKISFSARIAAEEEDLPPPLPQSVPRPGLTSGAAAGVAATASPEIRTPEIKTPVKLRPPADLEPHPFDRPPTRPITARPVAPALPVTPTPHTPTIEDEDFLFSDPHDMPHFPDLDFIPLEEETPARARSAPAPAPATPAARLAPATPAEEKSPALPRAAINKADLHFESDASLVHSSTDHFLLDTHGLVKIYDGRTVVNGVDINVRAGEIVGLLGPNGAGKTTSFYMIVGLVPPNGGRVLFNGTDVTSMPMYQRARLGMGYLPQEESIFRKLTVEENIMAVMETLDLSRKERQSRCQELLERFSITHIRKNIALTCSGGEKRRLTIARSLVTRPSLLMLDEPFSGVDPIAVNEIQNIVEDLRKSGLAILITDHNARQTLELVDRAYLIYEGKVLREGTRDFLINDPVSRELYLGDRFTM